MGDRHRYDMMCDYPMPRLVIPAFQIDMQYELPMCVRRAGVELLVGVKSRLAARMSESYDWLE